MGASRIDLGYDAFGTLMGPMDTCGVHPDKVRSP